MSVTSVRPTFKEACAGFIEGNRDQFLEHQCYAIEVIANKMLESRTPEDIAAIDAILVRQKNVPSDLIADLETALLDASNEGSQRPLIGARHEYFAAVALGLVRDIRSSLGDCSANDEFQRWAERQAGGLIEKAFDEFIESHFPGREAELLSLLEIGFFVVTRKFLGQFQTTVLPAMPPVIDQILETPGIFDVLKAGIAEIEWRTKADAARKAGRLGHKRTKPARDFAIARFREKKWPSARQAAIKIYPLVVEKFGEVLQADRAEITLQEWFLKDQKEQKQKND